MSPLDSIDKKERAIVRAIALLAEPTRARIAGFASLSTVSVTALLSRLLQAGVVRQGGTTGSTGGRRPTLYRIDGELWRTIGIFLDTDRMDLVVTNPSGEVIECRNRTFSLSASPARHPKEILALLCDEIASLIRGPLAEHRVLTIGVAPPGMVDTGRGLWLHGLQLSGIEHVDLRATMEKTFGVPVLVEDPARALAWLHSRSLPPEESRHLLLLYLSHGVGGGALVNGELYHGRRGLAGEIGHLAVEPEGDRCSCGNLGCLETVVSVPGILRRFQRRLDEGVMSILQPLTPRGTGGLTLGRIAEAAAAGDRMAVSTLFEIGSFLGDACAVLVKLFDPSALLLAGPAVRLADSLREAMTLRLRQQVLPELLADLPVRAVAAGTADEAHGAALLAERAFWMPGGPARGAPRRSASR